MTIEQKLRDILVDFYTEDFYTTSNANDELELAVSRVIYKIKAVFGNGVH